MEKKVVMFVMSMGPTMGYLMPAPFETCHMDEFREEKMMKDVNNNDNNKEKFTESKGEYKSRWSHCADIISLFISQIAECRIDILICKWNDLGTHLLRGNTEDRLQATLQYVKILSCPEQLGGPAKPDHAILEIRKLMSSKEYQKKEVHWFWDVESFLTYEPNSIASVKFENLTIYIVGELRTLHEKYAEAKRATSYWDRKEGVRIRFLACGADIDDLKAEFQVEKRLEWREKTVKCFVAKEGFDLKLMSQNVVTSPKWPVSAISVIGFLPEIEMSRIIAKRNPTEVDDVFYISTTSKLSRQVIFSIANHLLSDPKRSLVCLCKCIHEKEDKIEEYAYLVADKNELNQLELKLIRNQSLTEILAEVDLKTVAKINEPTVSLPDESYSQIAPIDHRAIRKRLAEIENEPVSEAKKRKFDEFAKEYKLLNASEVFLEYTATWRAQNLDKEKK